MAFQLYAQGQNHVASVYFQATAFTGPFYVGLGTGSIPEGRAKTLADVVEVTGSGYARISVLRDNSVNGWTVVDNVASSPTLTVTNSDLSNDWTSADYAFLTLSPSGTTSPAILLATVEIPEPFQLEPGISEQFVFHYAQG